MSENNSEPQETGWPGADTFPASPPYAAQDFQDAVPASAEAANPIAPTSQSASLTEYPASSLPEYPASSSPPEYPTSSRSSRQRKIWAGGIALLLLVGIGIAFAVRAFPESGAKTPEAAMARFSEAALTQDWLNVVFMLEPTERRVYFDRIEEMQDELVRLGVLDESESDLKDLGGAADLTVADLVTSVERVNDDIYRGWIDNAHISGDVDLSEVPSLVTLFNLDPTSETIDDNINTRESRTPLTLVERDNKWYVSIAYTLAENVRIMTGSPAPDPSARLQPIGGDSPEDAATQLVASMFEFDFPTVVAMIDPLELGVVYDYWSLFGADVEDGTLEFQSYMREKVRTEVSDLAWETKTDGDDAWVRLIRGRLALTANEAGVFDLELNLDRDEQFFTITGVIERSPVDMRIGWGDSEITFLGTVEGEAIDVAITRTEDGFVIEGQAEGKPVAIEAIVEGDCLTVTGTFGTEAIDDETCEPGLEEYMRFYTSEMNYPDPTMRMRRVDDQWFYSPTSTMMDAMLEFMKMLEPEDVEALERAVEDGIERGESVAESQFNFEEGTGWEDILEGSTPSGDEDELDEDFSFDSEDYIFEHEFANEFSVQSLLGLEPLGTESVHDAEVLDADLGGTLKDGTHDSVTIVVDTTPVFVRVSSDDFDTRMGVVEAASETLIDVNDDFENSSNSAVLIEEPGVYHVLVYSFDGSGGQYSVVVSPNG